ncbi:hypothetical protein RG677_000629 [Vibrio parahaemolyticus]|uniref:hypothetical protein n=1 Tax=Vibrio parahaemolyticus TaxID=670 RepID=UPI0012996F23|nr:hypothetical protein [Vibrio parahaemolyticus]EJB8574044.1 hypothetical protein [Vibrio parahaemolyticus]ELB2949206.1 hypothetical protein [Vibrio parahaemolyticus]MCZ6377831.1 hypothetical protein [Vibrio parahaemolyticus]MRD94040.1 hypothetical protein [Vibrio parahaemolyticus]
MQEKIDLSDILPSHPIVQKLNSMYFRTLESGRSMKKRNELVFDHLKEACKENGYNQGTQKAICIKNDEDSKLWLQFASSHELEISTSFDIVSIDTGFSLSVFYYNMEKYLIISEVDSVELDPNGFELIENNSGIFTLFSSVGIIKSNDLRRDSGEIYEHILFEDDDKDLIRYVELEDIIKFYQPFFIFKFIDESIYKNMDMSQLSSYIALEINSEFYNEKEVDLYSSLKDFIINGDPSINLNRLAKSICVKSDLYALYMDLYKMLERLYSLPSAKALKSAVGAEENCLFMLVKSLEKTTGWRKNEKEGLILLFQSLTTDEINHMYEIIEKNVHKNFDTSKIEVKSNRYKRVCDDASSSGDEKGELREELELAKVNFLCNYIYSVRNSYVHYRELLDTHLSKDQLVALCKAMLIAVDPIYVRLLEN